MGYLTADSFTFTNLSGTCFFYNTVPSSSEDVKSKMDAPKTTCPFRFIHAGRAMCGKREAIKAVGNYYFSFNLVSSLHFVHIDKQLKHNPYNSSQNKDCDISIHEKIHLVVSQKDTSSKHPFPLNSK